MKALPLLLLPFLIAPVSAESIGDRSNRQAYEDAPSRNWNWFDSILESSSSSTPYNDRVRRATNSYQAGYSSSSTCTRKEYREEYVLAATKSPGYINSWHDTVEVPCRSSKTIKTYFPREPSPDGNECSEGAILGGILGGGAGAALSQGDGRWWAIPLGIVSGAVIGCDIDGG